MKKTGKIATLLLAVCMLMCMLIGCNGVKGTYTMDTTVDVEYGGNTLHMPYHYELTVDGNRYEMLMCIDLSGGFAQAVGWSGKCKVDGDKVVCEKAEKYYKYDMGTVTQDDNGVRTYEIDKTTKTEEEAGEMFGGAATYIVDNSAKTFKEADAE